MPDVTDAVALARNYLPLDPVTVAGRLVQPLMVSYDLYVALGLYLDTGEIYGSATGESRSPELMKIVQTPTQVRMFMPAASARYTEWVFQRDTNAGNHYDIWHNRGCWDASMQGFAPTRVQQLIRSDAELEAAILVDGAADFVGGSVHGWQVLSEAVMFVDGKPTSMNQTANYSCRRIDINQKSKLYTYGSAAAPADELADVWTQWAFQDEQLVLTQTIRWLKAVTLDRTYAGIFSVFRNNGAIDIVVSGRRSPYYELEDLSTNGYTETYSDASELTGYSPSGYRFVLRKEAGWDQPGRRSSYSPSVQNKFYQDIYGRVSPGNTKHVTSIGEQITVTSRFSIQNPF